MPGSWLGRVLGRGDSDEADQRLNQAADAGDWPAVLHEARRALRARPDDARLLHLAAQAVLETDGSADEAASLLDRALAVAPREASTHYLRGLVDWQCGRLDGAVEAWRRAWQLAPGTRDIGESLTAVWVETGQLPEWGIAVVETTLLNSD